MLGAVLSWRCLGRHRLRCQTCSRIGENPPYGMIGGIEETSASFEARSAPRSYPTAGGAMKIASLPLQRREFITLLGGALWGNAAMAMTLKSPAFQQNGHIPSKYTCEGEDVSPPLSWEDAPKGAKSLVLIIDDPDAPDPKAPRMVWVHWVVYNMPPDTKSLPENAGKARLPQS